MRSNTLGTSWIPLTGSSLFLKNKTKKHEVHTSEMTVGNVLFCTNLKYTYPRLKIPALQTKSIVYSSKK